MLQCHEAILRSLLLQLLVLRALDQAIDSSLPQKISFHLLCCSRLSARRSLVHPVYTIDSLSAACCLKLGLDFLLCTLLLQLFDPLFGALAFIESFLFFLPHPPLIAHEHGMP
jgi:hypothetical protein